MNSRNLIKNCLVALLAFLLVAVAGSVQSRAATQPAGAVPTTFTVTGLTSVPNLPDAIVELRVGSASFSSVTDATGRFEVTGHCGQDLDEIVYLVVMGSGTQSKLHMARVLDACVEVLESSLNHGSYRTGPVNPVSTGMYAAIRWFAERENNYQWPMSASELREVQYLLGGQRIATVASAIGYWEEGLGTMPPGIHNSLELALDRSALSLYVNQIKLDKGPDVLEQIARRVLWDPRHFSRPPVPKASVRLAAVCAELQSACGESLILDPDQSGEFVNRTGFAPGQWLDLSSQDFIFPDAFVPPTGNLQALQFIPDNDQVLWSRDSFGMVEDPDLGMVWATLRTSAIRAAVRMVQASDLISPISIQYDTIEYFPDYPDLGVIERRDRLPELRIGILDWDTFPSWPGPVPGEQWVLPLRFPEQQTLFSPFTATRVQFGDMGQAVLLDGGQVLTWSVDGQRLSLSGDEFGQQHLYLLGGNEGRHKSVFVEAAPKGSSSQRASSEAVFKVSTPVGAWEPDQVAGRYVSGFAIDNWLSASLPTTRPYFVFDLYADGTGLVGHVTVPDAPIPFGELLAWAIDEGGGLVIRRNFTPDFAQWRRWERLTDTEGLGDLYVREATPVVTDQAIADPPNFDEYRVNFYRRVPIPE